MKLFRSRNRLRDHVLRDRIWMHIHIAQELDADVAQAVRARSASAPSSFLMQSFKNALLSEPLSFCSFACFRQATDFAALCSSCWVGLMVCALEAILTWHRTSFAQSDLAGCFVALVVSRETQFVVR